MKSSITLLLVLMAVVSSLAETERVSHVKQASSHNHARPTRSTMLSYEDDDDLEVSDEDLHEVEKHLERYIRAALENLKGGKRLKSEANSAASSNYDHFQSKRSVPSRTRPVNFKEATKESYRDERSIEEDEGEAQAEGGDDWFSVSSSGRYTRDVSDKEDSELRESTSKVHQSEGESLLDRYIREAIAEAEAEAELIDELGKKELERFEREAVAEAEAELGALPEGYGDY